MKHLAVLILIFFLSACKSPVPDDVLPADKMQAIYWDLMRADEMVNYHSIMDTGYSRTKHQDSFYSAILAIHKVNHETFLASKYYYETHPEKLKPILDSIHRKGEKLVNAVGIPEQPDTIRVPPPQKTDTTPAKTLIPDTTRRRKGLILEKAN